MLPAHGRAFLRVLVAVGISGLAAEVVFIGFNVLTRASGSDTSDLMLGETAFAAVVYGCLFGLVVLARRFPTWAFPPPTSHETRGKKRMSARFLVPMALAMFAVIALMQVVFLAIGWATAMDVVSGLLHFYPIFGVLVAIGIQVRGPSIAPPALGAG